MPSRLVLNHRTSALPPDARPGAAVHAFHQRLPGYARTPLRDMPALAAACGVGRVLVKDESSRLGLPAFKILGASWATYRVLCDRLGGEPEWTTLDDLAGVVADRLGPLRLVAATDGNHGRAVARFTRLYGRRAHIFVPDGVQPTAVQAIRDEGATVSHVPGSYDDAVHIAAAYAADDDDRVLVQDTAWEGYEDVPGRIVDGYSTLFAELDDQLCDRGIRRPDLVVVPTGVGSLLQAALTHYRSDLDLLGTTIVSVEPVNAACVLTSVTAGQPVAVDTGVTVMAGLNCGTVSTLAWPYITHGLDACVTVTDAQAVAAAHDLTALGVPAGPCGAAALAAARVLKALPGLSPTATVVLLVTEGAAANPGLVSR
jgi:diaminopropionate ammonia-lyase